MSGSLAEGVARRVAYKFYTSGGMSSNAEPVLATDPGPSGGQILRHITADYNLMKDTFASGENRSDRQQFDMNYAGRRTAGTMTGELAPQNWQDWFQALMRGTWGVANISKSNTEFTSVAADSSTSKFTFAGGDPVAEGVRVGGVLRFAGLSATQNNGGNFVVTAMGGTSNREITVFPAPTTMAADTTFTVVLPGRRIIVPNTGHISRKLLIEIYQEDVDSSRVFTEHRVTGVSVGIQPGQPTSCNFTSMGRGMVALDAANSPFLTAPAAETLPSIISGTSGLVMVGGVALGVMTGLSFDVNLNPDAPMVVGQRFTPQVFLGRFLLTGTMTVLFENMTLYNHFINETEFSVLGYYTSTPDALTPAMTFFMPRVKASGASLPAAGEGAQVLTIPFTALRGKVAGNGIDATTLQIVDTEAL